MKFGFKISSLTKRMVARTSWKGWLATAWDYKRSAAGMGDGY